MVKDGEGWMLPRRKPITKEVLDRAISAEEEVASREHQAQEASGRLPGAKQARLTIDLPPHLHARFKAACAINRTRMVEEVTRLIEDWTQKHS